jgi:hypothetical protein
MVGTAAFPLVVGALGMAVVTGLALTALPTFVPRADPTVEVDPLDAQSVTICVTPGIGDDLPANPEGTTRIEIVPDSTRPPYLPGMSDATPGPQSDPCASPS